MSGATEVHAGIFHLRVSYQLACFIKRGSELVWLFNAGGETGGELRIGGDKVPHNPGRNPEKHHNRQDVYFHIVIHLAYRKNLQFLVGPDHYQYKVLQFVLSTVPIVFTKYLVVMAAHLRRHGIHIEPYLESC